MRKTRTSDTVGAFTSVVAAVGFTVALHEGQGKGNGTCAVDP